MLRVHCYQKYGRVRFNMEKFDLAMSALTFAVFYHYNLQESRDRLLDSAKDCFFLAEAYDKKKN